MRFPRFRGEDKQDILRSWATRRPVQRSLGNTLLILAVLVAICFSSLSSAQAAIAGGPERAAGGQISRTGWLLVTWGDGKPGSNSTSTIVTLTNDVGETTPIKLNEALARPYGGILGLNRKRVAVKGSWARAQGLEVAALHVESIQLDLSASALSGSSSIGASAVSGPQPWINILCKFSDISGEPEPLSYFDGIVGETEPGLDHYWREASYNNINIVGSGSAGWYTLPQTRSYYLGLSTSGMLNELFNDCTSVADDYVYYPDYVGVNLMFNEELNGSAWGGAAGGIAG